MKNIYNKYLSVSIFEIFQSQITYVAVFCFVEVYIQDKSGHPRWLSGPLMFKLPKSRGEIPLGFPPIL